MNPLPGLGDRQSHANGSSINGSATLGASHTNSNTNSTPMNDSVEDFLANIFATASDPPLRRPVSNPISVDCSPAELIRTVAEAARTIPAMPEPPASTVPHQLTSSSDLPLPQHLLYGTAPESLGFSISTVGLQKLPVSVLRTLALKGSQNGVVVMMRNYDQVELMHRLKSFLDTGKYHPFDPSTVLEYIDETGSAKPWNYRKDHQVQAVKVTQNTQELFQSELDLYAFAMELGYDELRRESAANIQKYPKNTKGIWMMVERINAFHSSVLRKHTMDLLDGNGAELTKLPEYLPFLKKLVKFAGHDRELGERLLENLVSAQSQGSVRRSSSSMPKLDKTFATGANDVSVGAPRGESLDILNSRSSTILHEEHLHPSKKDRKRSSSWNLGLEPEDLPGLASAVYNSRLVIAVEEGWGTLTRQGTGRNRDFKFQAGELMLLSYDSAVNGHNNVIVINSKGERGDIRRNYVREIPLNMGIDKGKYRSLGDSFLTHSRPKCLFGLDSF
jgi:hypothetical protein